MAEEKNEKLQAPPSREGVARTFDLEEEDGDTIFSEVLCYKCGRETVGDERTVAVLANESLMICLCHHCY